MKKRIALICAALSLAALMIAGGTLAFFHDSDSAVNVFTVGKIDVTLTEPSWNADNAVNVVPGRIVPKDPTIKNTGKNDAYVRVVVSLSHPDTWRAIYATAQAAVDDGMFVGFDASAWTLTDGGVVDGAWVITMTRNEVLKPGESATPFTAVKFSDELTKEQLAGFADDNVTLTVTAEAIQAEGFDSAAAAFAKF